MTTIDTTIFWDGSSFVQSFGEDNTATYGQTFTAGSSPLTEFTFYLNDYSNSDSVDFAAYVMAWDGTKATGPVLYSSAMWSSAGSSDFEILTFDTGELILTPGQRYVAFLSASNFFDGEFGTASVGYMSGDVYSDGMFVYSNNGSNFESLTANDWTIGYGGDLAFKASFGDGLGLYGQKYEFTYYYGNGDSYSGIVYAAADAYSVGDIITYGYNETGEEGYYSITGVDETVTGTEGQVIVTSYVDDDMMFGETTDIYPTIYSSPSGYSGLGSEYGYAYNANFSGDSYFTPYYEADLPAVVQVSLNLLADDGGEPGAVIEDNRVGLGHSFFVEILVADLRGSAAGVNGLGLNLGWDGFILESINFDPSVAITSSFPLAQDGSLDYDGFINNLSGGSLPAFELGQAIGVNGLERFAVLHFAAENPSGGTAYFTTTANEVSLADDYAVNLISWNVETYQPIEILSNYLQYDFTYYYDNGDGDSYSGYVYAAEGTYEIGQSIEFGENETGNVGYYVIDSIAGSTFNGGYNGYVYVTSYTDADTGFGTTTNIGDANYWWDDIHGYSGLGSEYGYAYDDDGNSSDSYFGGAYYEADILNQYYTFTYTYGNGDSYSGHGYALAGTYTEGQTLEGYSNETGNLGYYTINSVEAGTTSSSENNRVYITSYFDGDTLYGETTNLYSYGGGSGLGSEYGYAYDSNWSSNDPYFSSYYEADLVSPGFSVTDNSGNANDASIQFGTALSQFRRTYQDSLFVRPNYEDSSKYFEITNTGSGALVVSDILVKASNVTLDLDLSGDNDLLLNPGETQRVNLTYAPQTAGESFSVADGLVLVTNHLSYSEYYISLAGKSTYNSDLTYDGKVNRSDLGALNQAKKRYDPTADLNGDGFINTVDSNSLLADISAKLPALI
jgi:hypothetical protein